MLGLVKTGIVGSPASFLLRLLQGVRLGLELILFFLGCIQLTEQSVIISIGHLEGSLSPAELGLKALHLASCVVGLLPKPVDALKDEMLFLNGLQKSKVD